jgi:predicted Rdx family selenoprotein
MLFIILLLLASSLIIETDSFLPATCSSKASIIIRSNDFEVIGAANSIRFNNHHLNDRTTGDVDRGEGVGITIEYCSACRWMLRANWIASELLTTFSDVSSLVAVTLIPKSPPLTEGGIFRICAHSSSSSSLVDVNHMDNNSSSMMNVVLWDRKKEGCFPEAKDVKQRVRDYVSPAKDLGHSDIVKPVDDSSTSNGDSKNDGDCIECKQEENQQERKDEEIISAVQMTSSIDKDQQNPNNIPSSFYDEERNNHISIEYSTGGDVESCDNGLYRATYYANELLSMIYERNAWWKRYQLQQQQQQQAHANNDESHDIKMPIVVDSVTLIPNRTDLEILVRCVLSLFTCSIHIFYSLPDLHVFCLATSCRKSNLTTTSSSNESLTMILVLL